MGDMVVLILLPILLPSWIIEKTYKWFYNKLQRSLETVTKFNDKSSFRFYYTYPWKKNKSFHFEIIFWRPFRISKVADWNLERCVFFYFYSKYFISWKFIHISRSDCSFCKKCTFPNLGVILIFFIWNSLIF